MLQIDIKDFECKHHPKHQMNQVCLVQGCHDPLCCDVCTQETHNASHNQYFTNLEGFIHRICQHYECTRDCITYDMMMEQMEHEFLQKPDLFIEKLVSHINEEKKNVNHVITQIANNFQKLCQGIQEEIYRNLDLQALTLRQNYGYLTNKLNCILQKDVENANIHNNIANLLNKTTRLEEYEIMIRDLKNDVDEMKEVEGKVDSGRIIQENIQIMLQDLYEQTMLEPRTQAGLNSNPDDLAHNFELFFKQYMRDVFGIDEVILPLSLPRKETMLSFDHAFDDKGPTEEGYETDEEETAIPLHQLSAHNEH